ncbi:MAG: hypothetical protein Q4C52_00115 [Eubacteriales bacterium]|nr:hypothetical protein [Eubacteriales bacterium]
MLTCVGFFFYACGESRGLPAAKMLEVQRGERKYACGESRGLPAAKMLEVQRGERKYGDPARHSSFLVERIYIFIISI